MKENNNNIDQFLKNEMEKLEEIMLSVPRKKRELGSGSNHKTMVNLIENHVSSEKNN